MDTGNSNAGAPGGAARGRGRCRKLGGRMGSYTWEFCGVFAAPVRPWAEAEPVMGL